ncbi:MAG: NAD-dependent epimerase [Halothece sp. Uz-M2-17]|nr:NAD-dependent epimerase [Halothece sp. Uz-M2-17]
MKVLVTGAAGFIGFFITRRLLSEEVTVFGIDNLNDYYDVQLKKDRLQHLEADPNFTFQPLDLVNREAILQLFHDHGFTHVIHLAAQAGVRYSLENPFAYGDSNLSGFLNILEGCRQTQVQHLVFASSSSVYGVNDKVPFSETDNVDYPISLYAATKKANELMAHSYSHLYDLPMTGLRFFTVYGPWGRPDMAYFKFVSAIAHNRPIEIYNHGQLKRDFTYIDDVIEGMMRVLSRPPEPIESSDRAPYKIYNIGNNQPVELLRFIEIIESAMGKTAKKIMKPMQPGDVPMTYADVTELNRDVGYSPSTPIEEGIQHFVQWYQDYLGLAE